ncbi:MAG: 30S ribosomal protein S14 [Candidatus Pacebacteria bacterium]|jgi:small subunit ribosomal protein S14|nr:30S ribosomal protein S14 [Candidatus Paceibacterota bacterium]MBT4652378.1 30S ribosomal protein S14 [Candidatus Paceibacterota bacterium]MBT6756205.1 30S ribosomal protein S14 [Candidatus Paceibacterota bacterium]MBT6921496.1 30S ribosomal protein S14 [Candidatus Paceibacterota bacterium]
MAKKSKIAKDKKILALRSKYLLSGEKKPNKVSTRGKNRCKITGRPQGYMRYFGLSRITFRELALKGELPGVVKASK